MEEHGKRQSNLTERLYLRDCHSSASVDWYGERGGL